VTPRGRLDGVRIGLLGAHQAQNTAVVLALLDAIAERWKVGAEEAALRRGLSEARWPGRLEVLDGSALGLRRLLLDGAHNPAGATALATALRDLGVRRPTIVFGAMRTKKVRAMLRALEPIDPRFVFTPVDDPGAHDPDSLARAWASISGGDARTAASPEAALRTAEGDPVVVAGSLYLVGAVRAMLRPTDEEA
jgi:dihydrofolate synthase/folylpolyglutamate synthase